MNFWHILFLNINAMKAIKKKKSATLIKVFLIQQCTHTCNHYLLFQA